jgi:hypothetical protein
MGALPTWCRQLPGGSKRDAWYRRSGAQRGPEGHEWRMTTEEQRRQEKYQYEAGKDETQSSEKTPEPAA